jgi:hypothetical protein
LLLAGIGASEVSGHHGDRLSPDSGDLHLGVNRRFLTDPVPQLAQQCVDVLGRRGDAQQRDVAQVGRDGLGDARVLDLDGDRAPDSGGAS